MIVLDYYFASPPVYSAIIAQERVPFASCSPPHRSKDICALMSSLPFTLYVFEPESLLDVNRRSSLPACVCYANVWIASVCFQIAQSPANLWLGWGWWLPRIRRLCHRDSEPAVSRTLSDGDKSCCWFQRQIKHCQAPLKPLLFSIH